MQEAKSACYNAGMAKILVVEDDATLREGLVFNLQSHGYEVVWADSGPSAIGTARGAMPDLILLDVMLPGLDGFQVCRILRDEMSCPILMLTARVEEIDRVVGLEIGADDYINKPFRMRELLARIKAHLRHERMVLNRAAETKVGENAEQVFRFGDLVMDLERQEVTLRGNPINLKPKEYALLVYLVQHQGQALTHKHLLEEVWGWTYIDDTHTVDVHIHWLRELIEEDPQKPKRIVTVRGSGYRFER